MDIVFILIICKLMYKVKEKIQLITYKGSRERLHVCLKVKYIVFDKCWNCGTI